MAPSDTTVAQHIIELERTALERWGRGDPNGFLELSAKDVSYFDPFTERRLDGLPALRALYESIRGKVKIDRSEILEPRVQIASDVAVLTFRFESHGSEGSMHGTRPRCIAEPRPDGASCTRTGRSDRQHSRARHK
jgi:hypothetical protein